MHYLGKLLNFENICAALLAINSLNLGGPDTAGQLNLFNPEYGHTTLTPGYFGERFIQDAIKRKGLVVDFGAGLGVTTIPIAEAHQRVVAIDLEPRNLLALKRMAPEHARPYILTRLGKFPNVSFVPSDSVRSMALLSLLHFFNGPQLSYAMTQVFRMLEPGGRAFIEVQTPELQSLTPAWRTEYQRRVEAGWIWPGVINEDELKIYFPHRQDLRPLNLLDFSRLANLIFDSGFILEEIGYFARQEYPEDLINEDEIRLPNMLTLIPHETVGAVIRKPYPGESTSMTDEVRRTLIRKWARWVEEYEKAQRAKVGALVH